MRFSFWPGPNNSWEDTLNLARYAESAGWDGIWFADHFMPNTAEAKGPTSECWTTIAALAASVPRLRIGALVSGNTYRHPAVLAKMASTADVISGGRIVLGLGAGWQENEHQKYGIPFPPMKERMDRFEEACEVITSLVTQERTSFSGRYYQLDDAPLEPKPVQQPLPLLVGGGGEKRTMRIAAKYAQEWNVWGTPETLRQKGQVLEKHCADLGRDPKSITRSAQALVFITEDEEEKQKYRASGRAAIAGSIEELQQTMREYQDAGVDEFIVPDFNLGRDMDTKKVVMDRIIKTVAPEV